MLTRKSFLKQTSFSAAGLLAAPAIAELASLTQVQKLTILHTNDTHSRLDPFPADAGVNKGLGGVAARAKLIETIRAKEENVLLLDAGDIFQGTPYFSLYKGEPEIKAMSLMKYDACTIGNHDVDAGIDNLTMQLTNHANFPMIISNYDLSGTSLESASKPYHIIKKGKLKIGLLGLGIDLKGYQVDDLVKRLKYKDPIATANTIAEQLKKKEKCDLVICLSHLGYRYKDSNQVCDEMVAKETENIDLIIGGHTHTFLDKPVLFKNKKNADVLVNQVGWGGMILGRLDFEFSKFSGKKILKSGTITVTEKTEE